MDSLNTERMSSSQREVLMDQVKQQIVIANTQELLTKMGEKCFSKCISKPGSSLDKMFGNVYGQIHGLLEPCFANIYESSPTREELPIVT
ncbi:Mitochondrial import inner membrane translocase subunit Tim13-like [Homarus americanus]|uniref:Mitochondrial import inner membrane translocase subunit n=1 Tax=Homarus americanus TaxID=6706 RepID=A0A8J5K2M0_HOMAM|nr:Mitochondrial import inner membrane translocase subunit Tim13-like [Homarus americanus]